MTEDEQVSIGESEAVAAPAGETPSPNAAPADVESAGVASAVEVAAVETAGANAQPAPDESHEAPDEPRAGDEASRPDSDESRPGEESLPNDESRPAAEEPQSAADESQPGAKSSEPAGRGAGQQGEEPSGQSPAAAVPAATAWRSYALKGERPRPGDCTVIFARSAYNKIVEHLSRDVSREHGGLLLGHVAESPFSGELAVWVMDALPAKHTKGSRSRLTFTQETWADFDDVTERLRRNGLEYKRVGWYHSHPSFGVFLSHYDLNVCEDFRLPTHVALVYDPINHEGGFFVRGTAGYDPRGPQGFREFPNTRPASPPVDWRNIEGVEDDIPSASADGVRASEAGEPAEVAPASEVSEVLQIGKNVRSEAEEPEPVGAPPADAEEQTPKPVFLTPDSTPPPGGQGPGREAEQRSGLRRAFKRGLMNLFALLPKRLGRRDAAGGGAGDARRPPPPERTQRPAGAPATGAGDAGNAPREEGAATPASRHTGSSDA